VIRERFGGDDVGPIARSFGTAEATAPVRPLVATNLARSEHACVALLAA
jgi:hypothetical protein